MPPNGFGINNDGRARTREAVGATVAAPPATGGADLEMALVDARPPDDPADAPPVDPAVAYGILAAAFGTAAPSLDAIRAQREAIVAGYREARPK